MSRILLALGLAGLSQTAWAAPPTALTQGYLADANGDALTGVHTLQFTLYDDLAGSSAYWTELHELEFTDGTYATILGTQSPLDESVLEDYPVFLGLSIDGADDLQPLLELASVPYSVLSETAYNVKGGVVDASTLSVANTLIDANGIQVAGQSIVGSDGILAAPLPDQNCEGGQLLIWDPDAGPAAWVCGDESFPDSAAAGITFADVFEWNEAHGWGDHAQRGYLRSEKDPLYSSSAAANVETTDIQYWNRPLVGTSDTDPAPEITGTMVANWEFNSGEAPASSIEEQDILDWENAFAFLTDEEGILGNLDPAGLVVGTEALAESDIANWNAAYALLSDEGASLGTLAASGLAIGGEDLTEARLAEWNAAYGFMQGTEDGASIEVASIAGPEDSTLMVGTDLQLGLDGTVFGNAEVMSWNASASYFGGGDPPDQGSITKASITTWNQGLTTTGGTFTGDLFFQTDGDANDIATLNEVSVENWNAAFSFFGAPSPDAGSISKTTVDQWNSAYRFMTGAEAGDRVRAESFTVADGNTDNGVLEITEPKAREWDAVAAAIGLDGNGNISLPLTFDDGDVNSPGTVDVDESAIRNWNAAYGFLTDEDGTLGVLDGGLSLGVGASIAIGEQQITEGRIANWRQAYGNFDAASPITDTIGQDDIGRWDAVHGDWLAQQDNWDTAFANFDAGSLISDPIGQDDINRWDAVHADWLLQQDNWDTAFSNFDAGSLITDPIGQDEINGWDRAYANFDPGSLITDPIGQNDIDRWDRLDDLLVDPELPAGPLVDFEKVNWPVGYSYLTTEDCAPGFTAVEEGSYLRFGMPAPAAYDVDGNPIITPVGRTLESVGHKHGLGTLATESDGEHTHDYLDRWPEVATIRPGAGSPINRAKYATIGDTTAAAGAHTHALTGEVGMLDDLTDPENPIPAPLGDANLGVTGHLEHVVLRLCWKAPPPP